MEVNEASLEDQILEYISGNRSATKKQLMEATGKTRYRVTEILKDLEERQKIIVTGKARATRYKLPD